ncbi:hypothetical protein Hdeb2414_s0015g00451521 [Helianthus debilis subsp. tardiflorus]
MVYVVTASRNGACVTGNLQMKNFKRYQNRERGSLQMKLSYWLAYNIKNVVSLLGYCGLWHGLTLP